MSPVDVHDAISDHAGRTPDRPAVRDLDRRLSYAELAHEVDDLAAGLVAAGVSAGDRVALRLPNSVDFVVSALACLRIGAIFVPLAPSDPVARVDAIIADCTPMLVMTREDGDGERVERRGATPWVRYHELLGPDGGSRRLPDPSAERSAYAIYTSGTTGAPKGVLIGHDAFARAVHSTVDALGLDHRTRTLCVSPFYFDGSFATLFPTLVAGGSVVLRPRESLLYPRTFFSTVLDEGITYTGFSPSYLKLLLASRQVATLRDGPLEVVALGGEAASAPDIRALWDVAPQLRVVNRYGPTETTIAVTHLELTRELLADDTVPIGLPHPGVTFHLVDPDGGVVSGEGAVGELHIGGSQLMTEYWGAPELTSAVLREDVVPGRTVYRTGDLVYRDRRGELRVRGPRRSGGQAVRRPDLPPRADRGHGAPVGGVGGGLRDLRQRWFDGDRRVRGRRPVPVDRRPPCRRPGSPARDDAPRSYRPGRGAPDHPGREAGRAAAPGRRGTHRAVDRTATGVVGDLTGPLPRPSVAVSPGTIPRQAAPSAQRGRDQSCRYSTTVNPRVRYSRSPAAEEWSSEPEAPSAKARARTAPRR